MLRQAISVVYVLNSFYPSVECSHSEPSVLTLYLFFYLYSHMYQHLNSYVEFLYPWDFGRHFARSSQTSPASLAYYTVDIPFRHSKLFLLCAQSRNRIPCLLLCFRAHKTLVSLRCDFWLNSFQRWSCLCSRAGSKSRASLFTLKNLHLFNFI